VLQFTGLFDHAQRTRWMTCFFARYCVAVCCSVLQCVAMEAIIQACSKSELDGFILWQILCYCVAYTQAYCAKITTRTACSPGEKGENYTYAGSLILKRCSQSNHCVSCAVKIRRRLCFEENRKEIHNSWQESRNFLKICIFWCFCYHNQKLHTFIKKRIAQLSTRFS